MFIDEEILKNNTTTKLSLKNGVINDNLRLRIKESTRLPIELPFFMNDVEQKAY